jgi:hypothetical protein
MLLNRILHGWGTPGRRLDFFLRGMQSLEWRWESLPLHGKGRVRDERVCVCSLDMNNNRCIGSTIFEA